MKRALYYDYFVNIYTALGVCVCVCDVCGNVLNNQEPYPLGERRTRT